jgi:ribonuclease HI
MTALHSTLESIYNTQLPNPTIATPPTHLFHTYSPHSTGIYHIPPNPTHLITYPLPERTTLTYSPTRGELAWNWQDFGYRDGSKKGGPSPLGAAATHPASDSRIKILVSSTPPSHTINRAELAGIDIGLQIGHTLLLTYSACSLRLIQGHMNCPSAYRHDIHRDTLFSITHTLQARGESGIRTRICKIKAHNHSLGNDLAYTLAYRAAD